MLKNILVTGADGFIGRYLCAELSRNGYYVYGMSRRALIYSNKENIQYINCNLGKWQHLNKLFQKKIKFDVLFHLAANVNIHEDKDVLIRDNIYGTEEILSIAEHLKIKKIILMSSVGLFDSITNNKISEYSKLKICTFYHYTKYISEQLFLNYSIRHKDVIVQIIRISSPIGIGMRENNFLSVIINNLKNNKDIVLYGQGLRVQNYIDVRDIVRGLMMLLDFDRTEIINLVSPVSYSNLMVAKLCLKVIQSNSKIVFIGIDNHENENWIFDNTKLKKILNFKCIYSLQDSIKWVKNCNENHSN